MEGKKFKRERLLLGLSQQELAKELDISPNTISRYENEAVPIPKVVEMAIRLLRKENPVEES